ncbi:RTA1 domain protein [Halenospora varia]|nr:RTA1 domain protein [Halenospora varia]
MGNICDLNSKDAVYKNYCAQTAPAAIFSTLYAMILLGHIAQAVIYKKAFCWVVGMASLWETVGYIARAWSTRDQLHESGESIADLLVLLAPLWVNAFVYMVFGRVVYYYLPEKKIGPIKAISMAKWFVWLDVSTFIIQIIGGIMTQNKDNIDSVKTGLRFYTAGIALQEVFILGFTGMAIRFHWMMANGHGNPERGNGWKRLVFTTYASLAFITIRICFRLAEFASGKVDTVLTTKEVYFYVFEATPMFFALLVWNITHPGSILRGPEADFPKMTRAQKKAAKIERSWRKTNKGAGGDFIPLTSNGAPQGNSFPAPPNNAYNGGHYVQQQTFSQGPPQYGQHQQPYGQQNQYQAYN